VAPGDAALVASQALSGIFWKHTPECSWVVLVRAGPRIRRAVGCTVVHSPHNIANGSNRNAQRLSVVAIVSTAVESAGCGGEASNDDRLREASWTMS
jgi:hypothetical protein